MYLLLVMKMIQRRTTYVPFVPCNALWKGYHIHLAVAILLSCKSNTIFNAALKIYRVYNYGLKITDVMDIPCQKLQTNDDTNDNEATSVSTMPWIKAIFSPKPIDWLDEKINRRGPLAKPAEHCVSFDFEVSEEGADQFYPGQYGNFWCPDASMKSHQFLITHVSGKRNQLRVIFRASGRFTDLVARSIINLPLNGFHQELLPIPKIIMDGFHGPVGHALNHDKVQLNLVCILSTP
jgi:hypothetical protein